MGADIHAYAEVLDSDGTWVLSDWRDDLHRDYGLFGFLADVRNYSHVPVISEPRGLPGDASGEVRTEYDEWGMGAHSTSWVTLAELLAFDYGQMFWDRRVTKQTGPNSWDGAALAEPGEGEIISLREFLPAQFFTMLDELAQLGAPEDVRLVFYFDN